MTTNTGPSTTAAMPITPSAKRRLQNVALLLGGILFSLVAIEIGFRVVAWLQHPERDLPKPGVALGMGPLVQLSEDEDLVYEYRPNLAGFSNSDGIRGTTEYSVERPPNTIRVAGLGDSVMAGDLYRADETFMAVLGPLLNEAATSPTRFETFNFAVGGYNTAQELAVLRRKALRYDLDWAILGVVINDIEEPIFRRIRDAGGRETLVDRYRLDAKLPWGMGLNPDRLPWWGHSVFLRWLHSRFYWKGRRNEFLRCFGEIAEECRRNEIRLLVVILTEDVALDHEEDPRERWHGRVRKAAREEGAELLEMYPAIMAYLKENDIASYRKFWSSPGDPHPNVAGHRLHAELIFKKLEALGILEQKPRP